MEVKKKNIISTREQYNLQILLYCFVIWCPAPRHPDFWWPQLQQDWKVQAGFSLGTAELRDGHFSAGEGTLNSHPTPQECSWGAGKWDGCQWQCTQSMAPIKQDLGVLCTVLLKQNLPQYPTSTPCPKLRLSLPMTRLTAVEMAVGQRTHHGLQWEKQRSPSPRLSHRGLVIPGTGLNFIVY